MIGVTTIREYLSDQTTPDAILVSLESGAVAYLAERSGLYLGPLTTHTEILDGPRPPQPGGTATFDVWLRVRPAALTSVELWQGSSWSTLEPTAYDLEPGGPALLPGRLKRIDGIAWPSGRIRVVYDFGFADDAFPDPWPELALMVTQYRHMEHEGAFAAAEGTPDLRTQRATWQAAIDSKLATMLPARPYPTEPT